jgi:cobalt-zinc-cadmium efflux system protein
MAHKRAMAHDHSHDHDHHHGDSHADSHGGHGHSHAPTDFGRVFAIATILNLALVVVQVVYGLIADSVALLADAGHNFGDAVGLILAWGAHLLVRVRVSDRFTYGFRSASILSALINAVLLLIATGAIALEAARRLAEPAPVAGGTVMMVAGVGIVINGFSAWLLMAGNKGDLNVRGAFLHLVADALVSVAVVAAGGIIILTGWDWVDPAASLIIAVVIVWGTWNLLRESFQLSMNAVPKGIELGQVRDHLQSLPHVSAVHDLHVWAMSTTENAMTAHLVMDNGHPGDKFLEKLNHDLDHRFKIQHTTVQIEIGDGNVCILAPADTV